jgi:BCD family chlorophyll transporter-like MFS transporter
MLLSIPLLPLSVTILSRGTGSISGWALAVVAFLLFGSGTLISGPPYLALVHDSVPYERRGMAISIVQFMLVASFALLPLTFARLLPIYDAGSFLRLGWTVAVGAAVFWFISVWREERAPKNSLPSAAPDLRQVFAGIWSDRRSRRYALFLGASAVFAFMQDAVLEPFGGDVFGLSVGETTRFNAYWGSGVLLGMVLTMLLTRRWRPERQTHTTRWGLLLLALPLLALGASSAAQNLSSVRPLLILFGLGFGIFTVGGVSLLMAMSVEGRAGAYLGLWSVIQLVGRGAGIAAGGLLRDVAVTVTGGFAGAYASVFWIEALGALACIWLLRRVDVLGFAGERGQVGRAEALAAAD